MVSPCPPVSVWMLRTLSCAGGREMHSLFTSPEHKKLPHQKPKTQWRLWQLFNFVNKWYHFIFSLLIHHFSPVKPHFEPVILQPSWSIRLPCKPGNSVINRLAKLSKFSWFALFTFPSSHPPPPSFTIQFSQFTWYTWFSQIKPVLHPIVWIGHYPNHPAICPIFEWVDT